MTNIIKANENIMKKINIDHSKKAIIIPKGIAKKASTFGTEEYNAFIAVRETFPGYEISVRTVNRTPSRKDSKDSLRGLTYEYIERYLNKYGTDDQKLEYNLLRNPVHDDGLESKPKSYIDIRKWFLTTFPQVLDYQKKVDEILSRESA